MLGLSPTELIIILVIIVLLFGVGRISKIAGELGSGVRSFKEGLKGDEEDQQAENKENDREIPKP
jgi:sec-independent protein translocase protein TatA